MTDMLDIARSGLLAYRGALAVTAENIANVGTDGYRRRDIATINAPGARATPFTPATGGQGVSVLEVRRAFDGLAADRLRAASGTRTAAEAHLAGAQAIEALMVPGENGVDGALRDFFDALETLAIDPTRAVARSAVMGAGRAVAGAISGLGEGLAALRDSLAAEADAVAGAAEGILSELAEVSRRMGGLSPTGVDAAAAHPLADRRDALLEDLGELLPVNVAYGVDGLPTVRLGGPAGPLLLRGDEAAALAVSADDLLTLHVTPPEGAPLETRSLPRGALGGLSRALGAVDMAVAELDGLARTLAAAVNTVHRSGVDATGEAGGDLFRLTGWTATPAATNVGTVQVGLLSADDPAGAAMTLLYDGAAAEWVALDGGGDEIARGTGRLILPGVTVELAGAPLDGHRIELAPASGRARDMTWALDNPSGLAAAAVWTTTAAPGNTGAARLTVAGGAPAAAGIAPIAPSTGPTDVAGGVLGLIPAGTVAVQLASWGRPATTELGWSPGADHLSLTLPGGAHGFDLTGLADAATVATALADGSLRADSGATLSSLGLTVTVAGGTLRFARPGAADPVDAALTGPGIAVTGTGTAAEAAGGTIQVITRDGRHVAGTPLSPEAAAALLTPANGFREGAVYDASPLLAGAGTGYRGTVLGGLSLPGPQTLALPGAGLVTGAGLPLTATAAGSVTLTGATGSPFTRALPEGASAATVAGLLDGAMPGLQARAVTALELSDLPDGTLSFALLGANGDPVTVSALVSGGDAGALALAVNAVAGATGIRAERSPDGARLLLVQAAGHDITLSDLSPGAGGTVRVRAAGEDGAAPGVGTLLSAGAALRQGGRVVLTGPQAFAADAGGGAVASATGSGAVTVTTTAAGAEARLAFAAVPDGDVAGLAFSVTAGGVTANAAVPSGTSAAGVAAAVAASLRLGAPDAVLLGEPLAGVPPDGSALSLTVDGASFTLRMQGGLPVVSGPEPGRVTAAFDVDNRLMISAPGMTDGRGIVVAAGSAFGLGAGQGTQVLTGRPPNAGALPASLSVTVDGTAHVLDLSAGTVAVPPGFPGLAEVDPGTGALRLTFSADADLTVAPSQATGFGGPGVAIRVDGDRLVLSGSSAPLGVTASAAGPLGQSLSLSGLPPEDMIVAMTGTGTLRLSGSLQAGPPPGSPGAVEIMVADAATGRVALRDRTTGDVMDEGFVDAAGRVTLGGLSLRLQGRLATGDSFAIAPAAAGSSDAGVARALAALRGTDLATGEPGMVDRMARLQSDAGIRVAAAARSLATAEASEEGANRAMAAIGAVDLDAEAARLVELQQAYQASAQAMTIARDLFDILLGMF